MAYDSFEVNTSLCTGEIVTTRHLDVVDATQDYAERLAEAFTPEGRKEHTLRSTLHLMDRGAKFIHTVDSGIFTCEHHSPASPLTKSE